MKCQSWQLLEPGKPLKRVAEAPRAPAADEVLVEVAGCGICHTDIGFLEGEVAPRKGLPIVLGHEITGRVVDAGESAAEWKGRDVLVPAVIPCGDCPACASGRGNACAKQLMPGNDCDGGFATHVAVPARGLTAIDAAALPEGLELCDLSVVADAVTTPLQAIRRARVGDSDLVVVVGTGGVGTHAVQVAAACGARVIAIDVDPKRLEPLLEHGASAIVEARGLEAKQVRDRVREEAKKLDAPRAGWKVFECSGTSAGQQTAWSLLTPGGTLAVVGFTREPVSIRLSNLMAFDADAFGSWGCPPELYGEAVELALSGKVALAPFTRRAPLTSIEDALAEARSGKDPRRTILVNDLAETKR